MSAVNYPQSLKSVRKQVGDAAETSRAVFDILAQVQNRLHDFEGLPAGPLKPQIITEHQIQQIKEPLLITDRQLFDYLASKYNIDKALKVNPHASMRAQQETTDAAHSLKWTEAYPEDFNFGSAVITEQGIVSA